MKAYKLILVIAITLLACCTNNKNTNQKESATISYAKCIEITTHKDYSEATVKNPWKAGSILQKYILIDREKPTPTGLPDGTVVKIPIKNVVVYSSVHGGVIKEIDGVRSIKGVCDANYFMMKEIQDGLKENKIKDLGQSMAPTIEKVIELHPDAIFLSPYQNGNYGTLATLGIPIIECADYMESTPLGRAEWIKFFGLLYGNLPKADSIFNATEKSYKSLMTLIPKSGKRPKVITETITNGVWYVPGGESYMANILNDAGANYPWKDNKSSGSIPLNFEKVLDEAQDANFWLIKSFKDNLSLNDIKEIYPLNSEFYAFKKGGIYACNTAKTTLFEDFPFHPEILLKEYISIFYPNAIKGYQQKYFKKVIK